MNGIWPDYPSGWKTISLSSPNYLNAWVCLAFMREKKAKISPTGCAPSNRYICNLLLHFNALIDLTLRVRKLSTVHMHKIEITTSHVRIGDEIYSTPNISKVAVKSIGYVDGKSQAEIDREIASVGGKWQRVLIALVISIALGAATVLLTIYVNDAKAGPDLIAVYLLSLGLGLACLFASLVTLAALFAPSTYKGKRVAEEIYALRIESNNGGRDLLLDLSRPFLEQVRENIIKAMASSGSPKFVMNYDNSTNTYHKEGDHSHHITVNHYDYGVRIEKYNGFSEDAMDEFKEQLNGVLAKLGSVAENGDNQELRAELRNLNNELNEEAPSKTKLSKILSKMKPIAETCGHVANVETVASLIGGFFGISLM